MGVGTEGLPEVRPPTPGRLTQSREVGRSGIKYVINREAVGLILCRQAGVTFFLSGRGPGPQSCSQRCHWPLRSLLSVATDTVGEEIGSEGADWDRSESSGPRPPLTFPPVLGGLWLHHSMDSPPGPAVVITVALVHCTPLGLLG